MPFRRINIALLNRELANIMVDATSAHVGDCEAGLDAYVGRGGNCLYIHEEGEGRQRRRDVGKWLRKRAVRDDLFLCSGICHDHWDESAQKPIDRFTPQAVAEDISLDLELLGTDHLDMVYLDDNPKSPIEPMIDALQHELKGSRIRSVGVSNWRAERIRAANQYAKQKIISAIFTTELALLKSTAPLWPEYVPFDDSLRHVVREMNLGVFAHALDMNIGQYLFGDEDALARMRPNWMQRWLHPDNPAMVQRVKDFAQSKQITPHEVNVSWILNQPFPSVAIVNLSSLSARDQEYENASNSTLSFTAIQ